MKTAPARFDLAMTLLTVLAVISLAVTGMYLLRQATPFGLGLNTDSVYYVDGARNLLAGHGFVRSSGEGTFKPLTQYPPLFSDLLAGIGLTGLDPLRGARLVIILLYGLDGILAAWLALRLTRSRLLAILAAALMTFSSINLRQFSWLMSEPLYLALLLASFLVAEEYWRTRRWPLLIVAGLLTGWIYLTRYAGLSLLLTWLVVLLLFEPGWANRLRRAGLFLLAALPWVGSLMLRNFLLTGSTGNRNFVIHWVPLERYAQGLRSLWNWFLPAGLEGLYQRFEGTFNVIGLLALAGGLAWLIRWLLKFLAGKQADARSLLIGTMGLHIWIYLGSVLVTMNLFDATTRLDERILLPVYDLLVVLLMVALQKIALASAKVVRVFEVAMIVLVLGLTISGALGTVADLSQDGQGYSDHFRRDSQTMAFIREHDIPVFYTNQPPQVYIQTGKAGYMVPSPYDSLTLQARSGYELDLVTMKEKIDQKDGLLIFFFEPGFETDSWYLALTAGLEPLDRFSDAIIWGRVE